MCTHIQSGASIFAEKLLQSEAKNNFVCENTITLHTTGYGLLVLYIVTNRSFLVLFVCF